MVLPKPIRPSQCNLVWVEESYQIRIFKSAMIPRFCMEGLPKNLDFWLGLFCIDLVRWQTDKKQEIQTQSCKDLIVWTELRIFFSIGSDNIFNTEVKKQLGL